MEVSKKEILDFIHESIPFLKIKFGAKFDQVIDENGFTLLHHLIFQNINKYAKTQGRELLHFFQDLGDHKFNYHCFSTRYNTELLANNSNHSAINYPSTISPFYFLLPHTHHLIHSNLIEQLKSEIPHIYDETGINAFFVACYFKNTDFIKWMIHNKIELLNETLYEKKDDLIHYIKLSTFPSSAHSNYMPGPSINSQIIEVIDLEWKNKWHHVAEKKYLDSVVLDNQEIKKHKI
jgi:hypothetical protein